jgi:two-component system chemotaxis response regulator CheY
MRWGTGENMKALILDDSRTMRSFLRKIVKELGFEVEEAGDGFSALALLQKDPKPELILVDWNMPVMDGYEFIRAVRSRPENSGIRLMMVSSETQQDGIDRITEAGADAYLTKPITARDLFEKIDLIHLGGK